MLAKRIIPCLDVKEGRVVKGVNFVGLRDAGDPVEVAIEYDRQGADELVFLDITASHEKRNIIIDVVRKTAENVFMPFTVGGGVRTIDDIRNLLNAGADKVSINTAAVKNPDFVKESAERFGLSQLHQLRGRVGRGAEQSFCILRTSYKLGKESKERINAMVSSNDGFYLSEIDMKLRGPGSIEGTQQSGIPFQLRLANLITDQLILQQARQVAENILSSDPYLTLNEHSVLLRNIKKMQSSKINWSRIS
jgi:hypothetical protein